MKEEKKLRHYSNKRESVKITSQMQNIINLTHVTFQQELGSACSRKPVLFLIHM